MRHGSRQGVHAILAALLGGCATATASAADTGAPRSALPPSGLSRAVPASPAAASAAPATQAAPTAAPVTPTPAAQPLAGREPRPDYAIALGSQQEFENTALGWTFRVDNKGNAAPVGSSIKVAIPGSMYGTGGSYDTGLKNAPAQLVISVGQPCPETKFWKPVESIPVPVVQPGASVVVPQKPYRMPDAYAGMGCRFRAEVSGPSGDADPSNNVMHMITKTASLPDLVVFQGVGSMVMDGPLRVENVGNAPAGPSTFHYECQTNDPDIRCGRLNDPWKSHVVLDVPVPALKPGQSHEVKGSTPKGPGATWKAYADYANAVVERNENNNVTASGK